MKKIRIEKNRRIAVLVLLAAAIGGGYPLCAQTEAKPVEMRKLYITEYRDKMAGAWLGQMVGVEFGQLTEGLKCEIWSFDELPVWKPEKINAAFDNDDCCVEANFILTLDRRGIDVTCREAGIDFANLPTSFWGANFYGLDNLRSGIAGPSSGHPRHHLSPDALDYQIESDFSGILSPGMPSRAIKLGEQFGRLVSYGDGLYAGQFIGAMYSAAYMEKDRVKVVEAALAAIPAKSRYAQMARDVLACYNKGRPGPKWGMSWHEAWKKMVDKYGKPDSPHFGKSETVVMAANLNGAMILIGYLWGEGDIEKTMKIATACGFDSDCNPSNALGILGCQLGAGAFDKKFTKDFDYSRKFNYSGYTWHGLLAACEKLTRDMLIAEGGKVVRDGTGEYFLIPVKAPTPSAYEDSLKPGKGGDERYTEEELRQIRFLPVKTMGNPPQEKKVDGER